MSLDPAVDEVKHVSDLYEYFKTNNHFEILKRCISIFEMLLDYYQNIHQKNFYQNYYNQIQEAKKYLASKGPIQKIDENILMINSYMLNIRKQAVIEGLAFNEDDIDTEN